MISLTPTQRRLLVFIGTLQRQGDPAPSYEDMARHMGMKSKSNIHFLMRGLEERAAIIRGPIYPRAPYVLPEALASVPVMNGLRYVPMRTRRKRMVAR